MLWAIALGAGVAAAGIGALGILATREARRCRARRLLLAEPRPPLDDRCLWSTHYAASSLPEEHVVNAIRMLAISLEVPFGFLRPEDGLRTLWPPWPRQYLG